MHLACGSQALTFVLCNTQSKKDECILTIEQEFCQTILHSAWANTKVHSPLFIVLSRTPIIVCYIVQVTCSSKGRLLSVNTVHDDNRVCCIYAVLEHGCIKSSNLIG